MGSQKSLLAAERSDE